MTEDAGEHWKKVDSKVKVKDGEALFASSGTNIKIVWNKEDRIADFLFVTGGKSSNLFLYPDQKDSLDLIQGCAKNGKGKSVMISDNENPASKIIELLEESLTPIISKVQLKTEDNK